MSQDNSTSQNFPLAASLALQKGNRAEAIRVIRSDWGVDTADAEAAVRDYIRANLASELDKMESPSPAEIFRNRKFMRALALDSVGGILAALGIAAKFAHVEILPPALRFENYEWVLIGGGVMLMLPMVFYLLGRTRL